VSTAVAVYHGRFGRATLYRLNRPMTTHAHREGHLIFYIGGLPGQVEVSGQRYPAVPRRAVAVNPWEPHAFLPGDVVEGALFLVLYINQAWFLGLGGEARRALRFGRTGIEVTDRIGEEMERVAGLLLTGGAIEALDRALYALTDEVFAQSWRCGEAGEPRAAPEPFIDFRVKKSIRLMAELGQEMPLDSVAREAGLSRPHFYKLFREQTGVTPNLYRNTLLMERAIECVARSERSVTEIGFDLGFSSQSGFTRFFSAHVGMAPTDYRRAAQVLRV
jgi:AraC-like DNA-binding protein